MLFSNKITTVFFLLSYMVVGGKAIPSFRSPTRMLQEDLQEQDASSNYTPWWTFGLHDEVQDETALFYLGHSYDGSADVADVLETIDRIKRNESKWSWTVEFQATAERMEALAAASETAGHEISAGEFSIRASTYYRAALHRHPDPYAADVAILAGKAIAAFEKFLSMTGYPCSPVQIPYESTTLPAYLCLHPDVVQSGIPAPTILFNEGKDGWAEDGKFLVDECIKRGYNALLWDGPGMGKVIRLQGLPFRHDWENVVSPLINYLEGIPEVDSDNLALVSVSLGGFLAPRAAVFEHRLKALVPNPGVINWFRVYEDQLNYFAPGFMDILHEDPAAFDVKAQELMSASDFLEWGLVDSMWHHGVDTPSALMLEIERYNIEDMVQNITAATLVLDAEAEQRGQAMELYEKLSPNINKKYYKFQAKDAAQFHVQPGATAIMMAVIFDWLDDVFAVGEAGDTSTGAAVGKTEDDGSAAKSSADSTTGLASYLSAASVLIASVLSLIIY